MPTNRNFEFKGFLPDAQFENFTHSVIDQIQSLAPSEAFVKVEVTQKGHFYVGFISIQSRAARFSAADSENDAKLLLLKLASQIHRQIKNWKRFRFSKPYTDKDAQAIQ